MPLRQLPSEILLTLIQQTVAFTWTFGEDGQSLEPEGWLKLTGQTPEDSRGDGWFKVVHPDDVERAGAAWKTAREHLSHFNTDYRIKCVDGIYRWFNVRGVPILNEDGSIKLWVGMCLPIAGQARHRRPAPGAALDGASARGCSLPGAISRAARGLLNWSAADLSEQSQVSVSSIRRIESDEGSVMARQSTVDLLLTVFEAAGVRFTHNSGEIDGVRLVPARIVPAQTRMA
jgi:PAS domain S-box-containing protein